MKKTIVFLVDENKSEDAKSYQGIAGYIYGETVRNHEDTMNALKHGKYLIFTTDLIGMDDAFKLEAEYDIYLAKGKKCIKLPIFSSALKNSLSEQFHLTGVFDKYLEESDLYLEDVVKNILSKDAWSVVRDGVEIGIFDNYDDALKIAKACDGGIRFYGIPESQK